MTRTLGDNIGARYVASKYAAVVRNSCHNAAGSIQNFHAIADLADAPHGRIAELLPLALRVLDRFDRIPLAAERHKQAAARHRRHRRRLNGAHQILVAARELLFVGREHRIHDAIEFLLHLIDAVIDGTQGSRFRLQATGLVRLGIGAQITAVFDLVLQHANCKFSHRLRLN